jgi:hypothetical protein
MRLYLFLQYRSRRGNQVLRLTNDMLAEVGIDRTNKPKYLKQLEGLGLITVARDGNRNPEITVLMPARPREVPETTPAVV